MTIYLDIDPPRTTAQQKGERVIAWMGPIEPPEVFRGELTDGYEYVWEDEA